ncbi:hypothetical protein SDC9_126316 [bioreactor metagenome]|uniref:Uncharacterized protein n=1 Tax=bioreactor metagenome TaxID=1076179 RepID=A0A645CQT0_9ZZZZ
MVHPGHVAVGRHRILAPRRKPAAHGLDLGALSRRDAFGQGLDVRALGLLGGEVGHLDRTLVVHDHHLRERGVCLVVGGRIARVR